MKQMSLRRIIITGASGFVGRRLLGAFKEDFQIYGLARRSQARSEAPVHPNITWFQADIAEIDAARLAADSALLDHRDRVAALAQEIGRPGPDQAAADDRNVAVDHAHGAVYHRGCERYIGTDW